MWPWHRVRQADRPAERVGPAVPVPARQPEWATLPPIQRSVDAMRPVAPQQDFAGSLSSWRNPSFLAPLGHLVSADAPAGVIHRLIEPAAPPAAGPAGSALEFATPPPRRPKASVVQRMLATITPWATPDPPNDSTQNRDSAPNSGPAGRTDSDSAPNGTVVGTAERDSAPNGVRLGASEPVGRRVGVVQRSAPATTAAMTEAPSPVPILELPVLQTRTQIVGEPEPDAAPPTTEPAWSVDDHARAVEDNEVPTLGMDPPPSATQPVDGGAGGPADVTGQEGRASAPAVETSGRLAPVSPTVQRFGTASSAETQTPEDTQTSGDSAVGEVPTLGWGPLPSATQVAEVGAGGPVEVASRERRADAPVAEMFDRLSARTQTVQRTESGMLAAPPSGDRDIGDAPTLAMTPSPDATPVVHDAPAADPAEPRRMDSDGSAGLSGNGDVDEVPTLGVSPPSVTSIADGTPLVDPTVQRTAGVGHAAPPLPSTTSRASASRRLGLGPPLAPDAVTAQLSQATSMTKPPHVPPASFPARPASPPEAQTTRAAEGAPQPVSEVIVPLLGQSGSALPTDAPATDAPATDVVATTEPTVQTALDPSPPAPSPLLPVLRAYDSSSSTFPEASSAPPRSAPPVVARLVGDRTPPLLTATVATSGPTETGGRLQHGTAVQRTPADGTGGHAQAGGHGGQHLPMQPVSTAPLRPPGYPNAGPAALSAQFTPSWGQAAPVVSAAAQQAAEPALSEPALVVQTAPAEVPEALSPTAPATLPAQDIAADLGAGVPGEPDNPGQAPSAAPAGAPPAAAPAAGSPDELVKKLFDPLLRRLKTELRLDRERRGMLTDLRH